MCDLSNLRERLERLSATANRAWGVVPSGFAPLDATLPAGGLRRGTLVEWLAEAPGSATVQCALRAARQAMADDRPLVVVDRDDTFHPPGLGDAVDWSRVLLVRCRNDAEAEWAADQALRTSGVGAMLLRFDRGNERLLRRRQLAAEHSGALGLIVRRVDRQPEACFSDLRILVTPLSAGEGRPLRLELLRSRQGGNGAVVNVRLDDDNANPLPASATLVAARRAQA